MPPVGQFVVAFGAGLWTGLVFLVPGGVIVPLGVLAIALARTSQWRGVLLAALLLGCATGVRAGRARDRSCAVQWSAGQHAAILKVHDAPGERGLTTGTIVHAPEGCDGLLRLRIDGDQVDAGATVVVVGSFHPAGGYRIRHLRTFHRARTLRYVVRDAVSRRLRRLYGERAFLVEALVLGRRSDIPATLRAEFADSGLAHLLAISGLHIGFLAGWLVLLARMFGARRRAWAFAAVAIWGFVALLGFPAPATRAATFVTLFGVARHRQRHPPPGAVLGVAVLVVLAITPGAATQVGAWLSVAAVWGTSLARRVIRGPARRGPIRRLLAVSVGATLATAPITAFAFGAVAPIGIVANVVAVPLAGLAVPGVFASLVAGGPVAGGTGLILTVIERVARIAAAVPGGHIAGVPGVRFAAPWAAILIAATWFVVRRPTWGIVRRRLLVAGAAASWLVVAAGHLPDGARGDEVTIHFLDVGQGDAIAVRTPRGRWVLVDAGPRSFGGGDAGRRVVVPFLRRHGVRALDLVIVSHGDADHLGGVPAVVRALPPALVLEPGQPLGTELYLEHLATVDAAGAMWRPARAGDTITVDGVRFAVLHPTRSWLRREVRANENSVVVQLTFGRFDLLLTGDIGWPAESLLVGAVRRIEVLKVGHHGSSGSSSAAWLDALRPKVAVVSVGPNTYGHPARSVLERLTDRGIALFRTDRGGTVTVRSDGRYFTVRQGKPNSLRARLQCRVLRWLRSRVSSSNRNDCILRRPGNSPASFTTWP